MSRTGTRPTREEIWVSIVDAAKHLGVHPRTVRRYIRDGRLPVSRISTQVVRIRLADIDRFLNDNVSPKAIGSHDVKPSRPKLHSVRPAPARFTPGPPHP